MSRRHKYLILLISLLMLSFLYRISWYGGDREVTLADFIWNIQNVNLQRTLRHTDFKLNMSQHVLNCDLPNRSDNVLCMEWNGLARLKMKRYTDAGAECYNISWHSLSTEFAPQDCLSTIFDHWYGGSETRRHHWPIEQTDIEIQPYISTHVSKVNGHGSIQEPYWLTSSGVAIAVEHHVPLHVGMKNGRLCLKADNRDKYSVYGAQSGLPQLAYTVCAKSNVVEVHRYMAERWWRKPEGIPGEHILSDPIWSTWARYKKNVTQTDVLQYAKEIVEHGFNASYIEIDDKYTYHYGDYVFDVQKFPNPRNMIQQIHSMGFRVSLWVTSYVSNTSEAFTEGLEKGYFVLGEDAKLVPLIRNPLGPVCVIDMTNPRAVQWMFKHIQPLREMGVDTFKFDAGEAMYLPSSPHAYIPLPNPKIYAGMYVTQVYNNTNNDIEVRTGYHTQHLPIITRMMDKYSSWTYKRGLKSIIPTALQFSILGYIFIMPDMIGGNAYKGRFPSEELFIRWTQIALFMPSIQFSLAPWQLGTQTVTICQHMMILRKQYITPRILKLAKESVHTGHPIIRPLWWAYPTDTQTFTIDSQFLIGDDLLVAPIMEEGATSREVYIPEGIWKDAMHGVTYKGNGHIRTISVPLHEVAFFILQ